MMDPALEELYRAGSRDDEVSVILRLAEGADAPPTVRVVSRFGPIVTARLRRGDIPATWESDQVVSVKAGRTVHAPPPLERSPEEAADGGAGSAAEVSAPPLAEDGAGVVVGLCDWGFDFTHPNFRRPDGGTRLLALWDQRGGRRASAPEPFGHGRLHARADVDAALATPDPFRALGYHPASGDPDGSGSHGTHVADILAGNRREPGSMVGLASGAEIVFVHLAPQPQLPLENLGDSVGLLEGLDFCRRQAAGHPCVLHLSAGKTAGPHRGDTVFELAVDAMLQAEPGIVLVQSAGNYGDAAMHTHARIGPDQRHVLHWLIPPGDRTPNELEVWYSGEDVFDLTILAPGGRQHAVPLGERLVLGEGRTEWGIAYHRHLEPNSRLNHVDVFLRPEAPPGEWLVALHGREVVDGRLHAWIERDVAGRYQSRFPRWQATPRYTTNTICNCYRAVAVGAYDATRRSRPATRFTSRGPTADGRQKPELAAPGLRIRAARSTPRGGWRDGQSRLCVKSGTSMAAPWVSGTVALMFQAAGRPLMVHEVRRLLIGTAQRAPGPEGRSSSRLGYGYLDTVAAVEAARRLRQPPADPLAEPLASEDADAGIDLLPDGWPAPAADDLPVEPAEDDRDAPAEAAPALGVDETAGATEMLAPEDDAGEPPPERETEEPHLLELELEEMRALPDDEEPGGPSEEIDDATICADEPLPRA